MDFLSVFHNGVMPEVGSYVVLMRRNNFLTNKYQRDTARGVMMRSDSVPLILKHQTYVPK